MTLLDRLEGVVACMRAQGIAILDYQDGSAALRVRLDPLMAGQGPGHSTAQVVPAGTQFVRSPEMGVFKAVALSPDRHVDAEAVVGFVEVDALRLAVTAPADGVLGPARAEDGTVTGYHDILFELRPD